MKLTQIAKVALAEAKKAKKNKETPIGAVVFNKDKIISKSYNMVISRRNPIAHAEVLALQKASKKLMTENLMDYNLYVTLEPCSMCSHIISRFKIGTLYFGAYDTKKGSIENGERIFSNSTGGIYIPEIFGGIAANESRDLLNSFFLELRKKS